MWEIQNVRKGVDREPRDWVTGTLGASSVTLNKNRLELS